MDYSYEALLNKEIQYIRTKLSHLEAIKAMSIIEYAIGVDPAFGGTSETGIILGGKAIDGKITILGDFSGHHKPETWIYCVQKLAMEFQGTIAIEINHGGHLLTSIFNNFSISPQRAIKSKYERAITCYLLYKDGLIFHLNPFEKLEEQMLYFEKSKKDRIDALVWLVAHLNKRNNDKLCLEVMNL